MDMLDKIVRVKTLNGELHDIALVVGIVDSPTYCLRGADGSRYWSRQDLCIAADDAQADYWKSRALAAERKS